MGSYNVESALAPLNIIYLAGGHLDSQEHRLAATADSLTPDNLGRQLWRLGRR
jgi:hypothetical protein